MRVLLVEDEAELAALVAAKFGENGLIVDRFGCLADAVEAVETTAYSLAVSDRRLPDGDGADLVATLRRLQPDCPVILLTAMDAISDRIDGLDAGADDYITKPFAFDELMARIRVQLRRTQGTRAMAVTQVGSLRFDLSSREVWIEDQPLTLHRRELALLGALMTRSGRVVTRESLIDQVYGFDDEIQSNALDAMVSRLRRRLESAGVAVHTIRGVGYMLTKAR